MALQMKLLDEVGLIRTTEMEIKVPKDLTPKQLSVLHGFNQLLRLKQAVKGQESDPILFTYSFASLWCSVSRITATSAIKKLVKLNIIYIADQAKHLVQYLFTQFKTIKEVVKDSLVQTKAIKEFISEDIKEKYRQSKGYVKKASKLNQESLKSLQKIGNKGFQEKGEGLRKQKGVFTAMNTPKKINFRQATLLKKMIPQ
jgi:hypothetical protein